MNRRGRDCGWLYGMADALTPSAEEIAMYSDLLSCLRRETTSCAAGQDAVFKPIGSAATGSYLAGSCDIDAFLNFRTAPNDRAIRSAFRTVMARFERTHQRDLAGNHPILKEYPPPRVCIKANFTFCGFTVSIAGIRCTCPPSGVKSLPEDMYYHPDLFVPNDNWRREVRALKVLRRAVQLEGFICGFACELAVHALGRASRVVKAIASDCFHIDLSTRHPGHRSPFMSYPYTGSGNLLGRLRGARWARLVEICSQIAQ
jgi:hypothetical protein